MKPSMVPMSPDASSFFSERARKLKQDSLSPEQRKESIRNEHNWASPQRILRGRGENTTRKERDIVIALRRCLKL